MSTHRSIARWLTVVLVFGVGLLLPAAAFAALVSEDFSYTPDNTGLNGKNGGSGWGAAWGGGAGATSRYRIDADANLSYSGGSYAISQTGVGRSYGDYNAFRGCNRDIDVDQSGTIWFSVLIENVNDGGHAGIQFNNPRASNLDYNPGGFDVGLNAADQLEIHWGDTITAFTSASTYAWGDTHLLVGRLDVGAGDDSIAVWVDPANLGALATPDLTVGGADLGANLFRLGVFGYGLDSPEVANGYVDALRISDTSTAFLDVTAAPEPSTVAMLLGLAAAGLLGCLRRRRRG